MLAYAFTDLPLASMKSVELEEFENIHNLFAAILAQGIAHQLKQGLCREYQNHHAPLQTLRGRIDFQDSIRLRCKDSRKLVCNYDELSENTLYNQILKTTVSLLLRHANVEGKYKVDLKKELALFSKVEHANLSRISWNSIRIQRDKRTYRLLVNLCRLIYEGLLLTEQSGNCKLASFLNDKDLHRLYEKFLLKYYIQHFPELSPAATQIPWAVDDGFSDYLPRMQTDVTLSHGQRKLIIDAKFYEHTMQEKYVGSVTHISSNLYQIYTYVKNAERTFGSRPHEVSGLILYAHTDEATQPDQTYQISGNSFEIKTLDLAQDFAGISKQLNQIAYNFFPDIS